MKSWPGALSPAVSDFSATGALDLDLRPNNPLDSALGLVGLSKASFRSDGAEMEEASSSDSAPPVFTGALGLTFVVEASDLYRDLEEKRQSQRERQHRERIRPWRGNCSEYEEPEDQSSTPGLQTLVRQNAGKVQHDDEQWNFEADAEDEQQIDDEAEVLRTTERGDLDVVTDGQEEVQSLRHDEVRQDCAENEESGTCGDESDRVATLFGVEARVMNAHNW